MNTLPDIARPDAGLVIISEWSTGTPQLQRAAAETEMAAWGNAPKPAGLLSHNVLLSTDGGTVLNYSQWTDEAARRQLDATEHESRPDETVPGVERHGAVEHRLYRSVVFDAGDQQPGCIVAVRFHTDGHDTARHFVDTLLDEEPGFARRTDATPPAGMFSNHFHISTDGKHVVNYAEFADEDAHRRIVENSLQADNAVPQLIANTPGLEGLGFKRFTTWLVL